MVKIYNIQSNTIKKEDLEVLATQIDEGKDIILLNEDLRYEIIDFDKMTVMKSRNFTKNIYALYIFKKNICKYIFSKLVKLISITKSIKLPKIKR